MRTRPSLRWLLPALLSACAGSTYRVRNEGSLFGRTGNTVWVQGPWEEIQPSTDVDEVIDQLCPAIMKLEGAAANDYGQEYCGAIYSLGDGTYYASHASPLGKTVPVGASRRKQCTPPSRVVDARGRTSTLADYHSHPWSPSPLSIFDLKNDNQLWFIRIQFDRGCTVMKYLPYKHVAHPGEVYVRRNATWILIGLLQSSLDKDLGIVTPVEAK
ncbi:hypothetical protein D7Y13_20855 [Corallococcus praedator]|uniref:Lipoprotein n=1 Tax=Corallococcus praedator TaxID=2316724 RepID=A0ABX9QFV7_9BACT|nr:hypothetical protein D7X74_06255 [Corallococcus sp. CA047B]RKH26317.1 hypothetical protein D7X75_28575 [Corallococcus sp. CA031C]RKI06124.1 hypothetical protein D7Y13_20855 [Corallococcus praedator]